jgi:nucleotide-binding universal stress UspA family protein
MIRHILVPTDFSDTAARAAEYGAALAQKLGARLTLLHVFSTEIVVTPEAAYAPAEEERDAIRGQAERELQRLATELSRGDLPIESIAVEGSARDVIPLVAVERHVDLIVMGTHGRRGLTRFVLGSVAELMLRTAPCPVLTVGAAAAPAVAA